MQQLTVGQEYDVEAELVFNKKYKSYQYKPYVVISKRPSTREEQEKFLHALLTNSQANALISAYPNIVNEIIEGTDNVMSTEQKKGHVIMWICRTSRE